MKKLVTIAGVILLLICCKYKNSNTKTAIHNFETQRVYSETVGDSFSIFIDTPMEMSHSGKYPVVYLLDANFYFDIVCSIKRKYCELGILTPFILVGIGYKDFYQMDSLRDRDYTYPAAFAEDSFKVSGGGEKFLKFIKRELIPVIHQKYSVNADKQVLMGHSLGGFFVLYAMKNNSDNCFNHFIAASPSLNYGRYYLFNQFENLKHDYSSAQVYMTYGGLEDSENTDIPAAKTLLSSEQNLKKITEILKKRKLKSPVIKTEVFSNLGHMEVALPSYIKGMQWMLTDNE